MFEQQLQKEVEEKWKQMAEQAFLEEDEKAVEERCRISEEKQKAWLERKASELEKQRQREKNEEKNIKENVRKEQRRKKKRK